MAPHLPSNGILLGMRRFLAWSLLTLFSTSLFAACPQGIRSLWSMKPLTHEIKLEEYRPAEVCGAVKNQLGANLVFKFFRKGILIHQAQVNWPSEQRKEYLTNGLKLKTKQTNSASSKIISLAFEARKDDSYEVSEIYSKKKLGQGKF